MNELLTSSRITSFLSCPRKHYWRYEVGLRRAASLDYFSFGSAWHRALEARWTGASLADAYSKALVADEGQTLDDLQSATLFGLLSGYYHNYTRVSPLIPLHHSGNDTHVMELHPEVEFRYPIQGSRTFDAAGKIDGLGVLHDGRLALVESKTAGESIEPDSSYWLRLRWNPQVLQYVHAARALGWDVATVLYDVTRKPAIRQKLGESVEEFGDRLEEDVKTRPSFYYARREVPILEDDLEEFLVGQQVVSRAILSCRAEEKRHSRRERAWPRNMTPMGCQTCDYAGCCLTNTTPQLDPSLITSAQPHTELQTVI
jgi:hypothetical protein